MGALKEYVMPDGNTYQFREGEVPAEAKPVEAPKAAKAAEGKPAAKKKAAR